MECVHRQWINDNNADACYIHFNTFLYPSFHYHLNTVHVYSCMLGFSPILSLLPVGNGMCVCVCVCLFGFVIPLNISGLQIHEYLHNTNGFTFPLNEINWLPTFTGMPIHLSASVKWRVTRGLAAWECMGGGLDGRSTPIDLFSDGVWVRLMNEKVFAPNI